MGDQPQNPNRTKSSGLSRPGFYLWYVQHVSNSFFQTLTYYSTIDPKVSKCMFIFWAPKSIENVISRLKFETPNPQVDENCCVFHVVFSLSLQTSGSKYLMRFNVANTSRDSTEPTTVMIPSSILQRAEETPASTSNTWRDKSLSLGHSYKLYKFWWPYSHLEKVGFEYRIAFLTWF